MRKILRSKIAKKIDMTRLQDQCAGKHKSKNYVLIKFLQASGRSPQHRALDISLFQPGISAYNGTAEERFGFSPSATLTEPSWNR